MFNVICSVITILIGGFGSLVSWQIVSLDKWADPGEMQAWHDRYGPIVKIVAPIVTVIGLILLYLSIR